MTNFKTVMRMAKLPWCKVEFSIGGNRIVNADGHVMVWSPQEADVPRDVEGKEVDGPTHAQRHASELIAEALSAPLESMVKVNGNYLRRAISALETKGNTPMYLDIKHKRLVIAYEVDGEVHRAAVACMRNNDADL